MANAEQFGILSIVTALAVRFLFYEDWEENYRIRKTYMEELERASEMSESDSVSVDTNTSERYCTQLLFSVRSTQSFVITEKALILLLVGAFSLIVKSSRDAALLTFMIMSQVELRPGTRIQRNIPPCGTEYSHSPARCRSAAASIASLGNTTYCAKHSASTLNS